MLCESDTHRHITVKHTLHVHRLRHMDKCARPDTKCDTVHQRSRTRMSHRCSCMGAPCGALTPHRSAQGGTVSTCCRVQPCLPCTPSGAPSRAALRPLRRPRRRPRSQSRQGLPVRGHRGRRQGRTSQSRVLRAGYRAEESMSSARIAGAKGDGARVRAAATYVESA